MSRDHHPAEYVMAWGFVAFVCVVAFVRWA
jgi:hypothetical protein